jgi:HK97 family phage prohead protease
MLREMRTAPIVGSEMRADNGMTFTGHAAVFNQRTWIGPKKWGFFEEVDAGFFRDVLGGDTAFLVNHDPNIVLARNGNTMSLAVDSRGLVPTAEFDEADPDAVKWAARVRRGDVTQMSFAFTVAEEKWSEDSDGNEVRTLLTAEKLYDVSLVTYPAYDGTDAAMRQGAAEVVKRHRGYDPILAHEEPAVGRTKPGQRRDLMVLRERLIAARYGLPLGKRAADDPADASVISQALGWLSAIDSIVDEGQEALAAYLGVANPDTDDDAGDTAA